VVKTKSSYDLPFSRYLPKEVVSVDNLANSKIVSTQFSINWGHFLLFFRRGWDLSLPRLWGCSVRNNRGP